MLKKYRYSYFISLENTFCFTINSPKALAKILIKGTKMLKIKRKKFISELNNYNSNETGI